jgi:hypothetical protein
MKFIFYFKMAEAQILIIKQLKACMEISGRFGDRHEILVDVLLEGDGFLPSPDFLSVFSCDYSKSMVIMNGYLNSFKPNYIIPDLLFRANLSSKFLWILGFCCF